MKDITKTIPYIKYLIQKSKYNTNNLKIVKDIPDNYIDYMLVDMENYRLGEISLLINVDELDIYYYVLNISVLDFENKIEIVFDFPISESIYNKIRYKLIDTLGEPEHVDYNLNSARKFKVIKGGKLNGK